MNPKRTDTNIRYYDQDDLKLVLNVALLKDNGFKISKIAEMSRGEMTQKVQGLSDNTDNHGDLIYALTLAMIDLDELRFEKVISSATLKLGFERMMINVIYPFLNKIGIMWQTDSINPAQEHFMSNLIRQKLLVAIDGLFPATDEDPKKYLLFLPEHELHEISLLFASYLIKARNSKVIYLGQSMPMHDLKIACKVHEPDYLLTIITTKMSGISAENYLIQLANKFTNVEILAAGTQVVGQDLELPEKVHTVANIHHLIEFVDDHSEPVRS